jgi:hypothetical protein
VAIRRTLEDISADILAVEEDAEGLLGGLLKGGYFREERE